MLNMRFSFPHQVPVRASAPVKEAEAPAPTGLRFPPTSAATLINTLAEAHADVDFSKAGQVSGADLTELRSAVTRYEAESKAVAEIASALARQAEA